MLLQSMSVQNFHVNNGPYTELLADYILRVNCRYSGPYAQLPSPPSTDALRYPRNDPIPQGEDFP